MNYLAITGLSILCMNIIMVCIVLWVQAKKIQVLWALTALSIAIFGLGFYLMAISTNPENGLIGWQIGYIGVISVPVLMFHTVLTMTYDRTKKNKVILYSMYAIAITLQICNSQQLIIHDVADIFNAGYYIPLGYTFEYTFYGIFMLYFKVGVVYMLYVLYKNYQTTMIQEGKKQILFFGVGIGIGFIGAESCFFPTYGINIYPYLGILIGIYPLIILYSIFYHHLFDARYAILQLLRMTSILALSIGVSIGLGYGIYMYFGYIPGFHGVEVVLWLTAAGMALGLYNSKYISSIFLISSLISLKQEMNLFLARKGVYKTGIELISDLENFFWKGFGIKKVLLISAQSTMRYPQCVIYFEKYGRPLFASEIEQEDVEGETPSLYAEVQSLGESIFPINQGEGSVVFLVLGTKQSSHTMTEEEIKIIHRIIPKIALALQILEYNHALQNEVRSQTSILNQKNKELEKAYKRLQEIDHNKDNFLAIASHELRTPMTIIKGYSDLFLKDTFGSLAPEARTYMQKIYTSTESLIDLVNNILDISKIEAGRFEIIPSETDIVEIVSSCIENFRTLYKEKGIEIILTNEYTGNTINTDGSKIGLITTNLLSNGYKFTDTGGHVEVTLSSDDKNIAIAISDSGKGIEYDKLDHIFEKFNQADNTNYTKKSIHGTGLGLHLCKQIIQLLGGNIRVESTVGQGSTFTFFLPINHDTHSA